METDGGRASGVYGTQGRRTQADRDAITVEIGYALVSAAFAAALVFGVLAGPALLFALPDGVERVLVLSGAVLAAPLFAVRVVSVLLRFSRGSGRAAVPRRSPRRAGSQPSQPGRTSPDS